MCSSVREETISFAAADGIRCTLIHITGDKKATRGPVMLVHGTGVRANSFRPPNQYTIVDALLEHGYDVWLENWRASIDLPATEWTLDQAALYDHPEAVKTICRLTGADKVKVVAHCQGSTTITMSAIAGLLPQVSVIVSNAVSLHPVIPWISKQKIKLAIPLLSQWIRYLNPQWGHGAQGVIPKLMKALVAVTHHECSNPVCKQASFIYGTGFPTLWSHENLTDETHEWIKGEFAQVPLSFFRQMRESVIAGQIVSPEGFDALPENYTVVPPKTDARIVFFSGEDNRCFLSESQRRSYEHFNRLRPGFHSLQIVPGYGHFDIFMGKAAYRDVFPLMIAELERER